MEYFDIDLSAQLTRQGPIKFNADAKDKEEKRIQQTYCLMAEGGLSFLPTLEKFGSISRLFGAKEP